MHRNGTKILVLFALGLMCSTTGCSDLVDLIDMGAGSEAQFLCSNVFISGRTAQSVFDQEGNLGERMGDIGALVESLMDCEVDFEDESATCSILGAKRKSIYREHLGCTLLYGDREWQVVPNEAVVRGQETGDLTPSPPGQELLPWPTGEVLSGVIPPEVDTAQIEAVLDDAFSEPDPSIPRRTRGVVVVYDGQLVAERYAEAEGYSMLTPHYGWSMTKSVTNALIGILVGQGVFDIYAPAPVPNWADPSDPRNAITIDQLLRMSSGLVFGEEYDSPLADVLKMLYSSLLDKADYAASRGLEAPPDTLFHYSSGTPVILQSIIRNTFGTLEEYFQFPRRALFDKLGMRSAFIEPDPVGNFVGGSLMWATPRDWARFGLFCLQDGVWEDERILPEGWMAYSTTPTPSEPEEPDGEYGAHFWLNVGGVRYPDLPEDLFECSGHDGQKVTVIPSRNLIVVRVGYTPDSTVWSQTTFLTGILDAIGDPS
jgi:CubicO group peptidase (beta-lactamase class C family)